MANLKHNLLADNPSNELTILMFISFEKHKIKRFGSGSARKEKRYGSGSRKIKSATKNLLKKC